MSLIHERLDTMADRLQELAEVVTRLDEQVRAMRQDTVVPQLRDHGRRIRGLEAWRWKVVGAAAAVGMVSPQAAGWLAKVIHQ